ncbi:hypothetical protein N7495_005612 [Penicillium taxi]|uniref:uncharacterized protein n=1 Tax=Penicillium taxi TaxID=168475 RepID=UPI0025458DF3|nr:uncharacterized protein N7495_005612 [Penicillium taxi]KAJ5893921.1 hypothetical protein N7495_005612 [Penicillium taxi]
MAPANGHLLLPKIWRVARFAYEKAAKAIRAKLPENTLPYQAALRYQPAYARINCQPISRAAAIRQAQSRRFSTLGFQAKAAAYRSTRVASNISRMTSRAPFASTLRPNLTGGTLGRTAGGYARGGARYFSHSPTAPAEVIHNVSQGIRAFLLSGQKVRYDGIDPRTGENRYSAVSALQDQASRKMISIPRNSLGSHIDFQFSPTITAFSASQTLHSEGLVDMLSADFARALKEFAVVMNDIKRLQTLGDLPIELLDRSTIRIRFPGCDADTVERLCDDLGIQRGRISQDEDFERRVGADLALLFPFAPSVPSTSSSDNSLFEKTSHQPTLSTDDIDWHNMLTPETISFNDRELFGENPWASVSQSAYSSINISELGDRVYFPETSSGLQESSTEHDGDEGIYRLIAECDRAYARH